MGIGGKNMNESFIFGGFESNHPYIFSIIILILWTLSFYFIYKMDKKYHPELYEENDKTDND